MPKPTDPALHEYMFSDDMKFIQKVVLLHPTQKRTFLVMKRSEDSVNRPGEWDFPGGNVIFGEKHDESLKREVLEETGLVVEDFSPIQVQTDPKWKGSIYLLYIGYVAKAPEENIKISHEHSEYTWVTVEEFEAMSPTPFLIETIKRIPELQ